MCCMCFVLATCSAIIGLCPCQQSLHLVASVTSVSHLLVAKLSDFPVKLVHDDFLREVST